jgi:hypothetical protein
MAAGAAAHLGYFGSPQDSSGDIFFRRARPHLGHHGDADCFLTGTMANNAGRSRAVECRRLAVRTFARQLRSRGGVGPEGPCVLEKEDSRHGDEKTLSNSRDIRPRGGKGSRSTTPLVLEERSIQENER